MVLTLDSFGRYNRYKDRPPLSDRDRVDRDRLDRDRPPSREYGGYYEGGPQTNYEYGEYDRGGRRPGAPQHRQQRYPPRKDYPPTDQFYQSQDMCPPAYNNRYARVFIDCSLGMFWEGSFCKLVINASFKKKDFLKYCFHCFMSFDLFYHLLN